MAKALVSLYVPAVKETYDVYVPDNIRISILSAKLAECVAEMNSKYRPGEMNMLILRNGDILLNPDLELGNYGIDTGIELLLI